MKRIVASRNHVYPIINVIWVDFFLLFICLFLDIILFMNFEGMSRNHICPIVSAFYDLILLQVNAFDWMCCLFFHFKVRKHIYWS